MMTQRGAFGVLLLFVLGFPSLVRGQQNLFEPVIQQAQKRMVKVLGAGVANVEGYASGTIVSPDGLILSMQGVFLDGRQVQVTLPDGTLHPATVLRRDRQLQLSLLKIDAETPEFFPLGEEDYGQQGDWVIAVSNAYKVADKDEHLSVMMGIISLRTSIDAKLNQRDTAYSGPMVLVDAITSNPGAAGGAVVDKDGHLVGLIGKIINSSETNTRLNYAVPRSRLFQFVQGESPTESTAQQMPREALDLGIKIFQLSGRSAPPYVDKVIRGGLAAKAGIKPDDLIVSINGTKLGTVRDFLDAKDQIYNDQPVVLVVTRGTAVKRFVVWEPESAATEGANQTPQQNRQDQQPEGQGNDS